MYTKKYDMYSRYRTILQISKIKKNIYIYIYILRAACKIFLLFVEVKPYQTNVRAFYFNSSEIKANSLLGLSVTNKMSLDTLFKAFPVNG